MKETLTYLFNKNILGRKEAKDILINIGQGKYSEPEIAAFLSVFLMRKITSQELGGFRDAFLELCIPVNLSEFNTIDVCGTGGDGKNTFNISTLTGFLLAGTGLKVVKHGNYGVSSPCGSSNVMEFFGYKFSTDEKKLRKELEESNICYFHAQLFHPAMKHVGPVRKALKLNTFFNMLGPMVNPSRPQNQMVGVFNEEVLELYHGVYKDSGTNFIILYGKDGYDEVSLTGDFHYMSNSEDMIISPADLGLSAVAEEELFGGNTVKEAVKIFTSILEGKGTKAQNDIVIANAAMGIKCYYPEKSLKDCVAIASESLLSKNALKSLKKLLELQ